MYQSIIARLAAEISRLSTLFSLLFMVFATLLSAACLNAADSAAKAGAGRSVSVGVYEAKPLAYYDKDGSAHGFFVDMLNRFAEIEKWDVQYVPGSWQEGLDRLKNDQIDLVLCIGYTEEREKYMDFPKEYLLMNWGVLYRPKGSQITSLIDLEGKTVSALKGDVYLTGFKELVRQFNLNVKIQEVDQYAKVFKTIKSGEVAAGVAGNLYGILNENGQLAEQTPVIFSPIKVGYAVNKGKNGDLVAALDRHMAEMKADKSSVYYHEIEHLLGKKDIKIPKQVYWGLSGISFALLLAAIFIVLLKRQVVAKTEHLEAEIDEHKKAKESLVESESRWKFALEGARDGVWDWNIQTGEAFYSLRYKEMLGFAENEIGNTSDEWLKRIHPEDAPGVMAGLQPYLDGKAGSPRVEFRMLCKDGSWKWIVGRGMVVNRDSDGKPLRMIGTNTDITERKSEEEQIKSLTQRLLLATSSALLGVWDWNVKENTMVWDDRMFELYGITRDAFPNNIDAWMNGLHPEDKETAIAECQQALKGEKKFDTVFRVLHPDGTVKYLKANGLVIRGTDGTAERMLGINADITSQKRSEEEKRILEQQLQHTQKIESLGVLAGGIAHDFNNILAIIMGNCSLAAMDDKNAGKYIPEIEKASERAAALCRQMLAYAGKTSLTQTQINSTMLVDEMISMLQSTIKKNVVIKPDLGTDIPLIMGDASQIRQVVMNLIINAAEAIGDAEGKIDVLLAKVEIKAEQPEADHYGMIIPVGRYICFEVTDNGCGMDEATKRRIFEPFYTTKFTGRGLGMSAVLGIIKAHNGALQFESRLGYGTTFKVYLPVPLSKSEPDESQQITASVPWQGSGTILLAEDEVQVKAIAISFLEKLGFKVIDAANGKEALELYQRNPADITLVVTDMGMPIMNGYKLFNELKQLNPKLPIIISSGFGERDITSKIPKEYIAGLINKPYNFDRLRDVLRGVMEGT